ncbi:MAG: Bro-N domain-containing protein [Flavonifractor plautii]
MTIINESGLYSLVLSSKLPGAKKFRRWVTAEVLPAIRRTGGYRMPRTIPAPCGRWRTRRRRSWPCGRERAAEAGHRRVPAPAAVYRHHPQQHGCHRHDTDCGGL